MPLEGLFTFSRLNVVMGVISDVASLAPRAEIVGFTISWVVVKMGDGKDDPTSSNGVRFSIAGAAFRISGTSFAAISGAFKADFQANLFPVFRVT